MNTTEMFLSGLGGAILGSYVSGCRERFAALRQYRALLLAFSAECECNLGNVEEMLAGAVNRGKSYKRFSLHLFEQMQTESIAYDASKELLKKIAKAYNDEEVFNRELEALHDKSLTNAERDFVVYLLSNAAEGVRGSLEELKAQVDERLRKLTWLRMAWCAISCGGGLWKK